MNTGVIRIVREWHDEERHTGPLELCEHKLCAKVAKTLQGASGPHLWPGSRLV